MGHTLRALARESRIAMTVVVSPEDAYWETYDWSEWHGRLRAALLLLRTFEHGEGGALRHVQAAQICAGAMTSR